MPQEKKGAFQGEINVLTKWRVMHWSDIFLYLTWINWSMRGRLEPKRRGVTRGLSCRYPLKRDTGNDGGSHTPKMGKQVRVRWFHPPLPSYIFSLAFLLPTLCITFSTGILQLTLCLNFMPTVHNSNFLPTYSFTLRNCSRPALNLSSNTRSTPATFDPSPIRTLLIKTKWAPQNTLESFVCVFTSQTLLDQSILWIAYHIIFFIAHTVHSPGSKKNLITIKISLVPTSFVPGPIIISLSPKSCILPDLSHNFLSKWLLFLLSRFSIDASTIHFISYDFMFPWYSTLLLVLHFFSFISNLMSLRSVSSSHSSCFLPYLFQFLLLPPPLISSSIYWILFLSSSLLI